ncbi:MAG: MoxR family ATPase [Pontiellaceae bacterium]|nr:MoxR family ATPase [Pontiellaceae bacterium]MBN2785054.1 MoxR family ATPase [Pontiellaceae bacterium]
MMEQTESMESAVEQFSEKFKLMQKEVGRFIVGQQQIVEQVLTAVIAGGHVLLEGVPGLGKTALVHTLAQVMDLDFKRIQFTPDLLPADILGTNIMVDRAGAKVFEFQKGPIFTHILLADEINRATPKTQSALLETMQEKTVTVGGICHRLDRPYFVLATQNPIEMDGTYPLPEAQLDRFFFKLSVALPTHEEMGVILDRTTGVERPEIRKVISGEEILAMERTASQVPVAQDVRDYLIRMVLATHPDNQNAPHDVVRYVRYGASPRAAQTLISAARIRALTQGRYHVAKEDVNAVAVPALCHRVLLNFEGEAEGIATGDIIRGLAD